MAGDAKDPFEVTGYSAGTTFPLHINPLRALKSRGGYGLCHLQLHLKDPMALIGILRYCAGHSTTTAEPIMQVRRQDDAVKWGGREGSFTPF